MGNKYKKANELNSISIVNHATTLARILNFRVWMTIYKKAWVAVLLLIPQSEAFALPITVRTSNAEAHADTYNVTTGIPLKAHLQFG